MNDPWYKVLLAASLVVLIPAYWIAIHAPAVGIFHDDGIYLVTAKALAEGKGYRIISLPDEVPQTKYPILFPALLAGAWKIFPRFPENALWLKTLPLLFSILWLWLSFKAIREERAPPGVALWIILLTAASPWVVFFSATLMSETLFACLCAGALIWLKRLEDQENDEWRGKPLLISSVLAAGAFLTRTAGAPLVAAGFISMLLRKKYRTGLWFLVSCAVLVAPWFWWQATHSATSSATSSYYSIANYKFWNILIHYTWDQKIRVFSLNALSLAVSPVSLLGMKTDFVAPFFLPLAVSFAIGIGFIVCARRVLGSIHLFLLLYAGMILMWVWPPQRFFVPVLPLFLMYAYQGYSWICGRMIRSGTIQAIVSILLAILLGSHMALSLASSARETLNRQTVSLVPPEYQKENWIDARDLFDWIRRNTPPESVLLGNLDPTYYLYTGRKAVRAFEADPYLLYYSRTPETALGQVPDLVRRIVANRVDYIVQAPAPIFREAGIWKELLDRLISECPGALQLVKEGRDPSYEVYVVDRNRLLPVLENGSGKKVGRSTPLD